VNGTQLPVFEHRSVQLLDMILTLAPPQQHLAVSFRLALLLLPAWWVSRTVHVYGRLVLSLLLRLGRLQDLWCLDGTLVTPLAGLDEMHGWQAA
jgi:hypothetical protein